MYMITSKKKLKNQFLANFPGGVLANCISPNVGRYYGLVTGPPPAMEATMEAAATMAETAAMETATERF